MSEVAVKKDRVHGGSRNEMQQLSETLARNPELLSYSVLGVPCGRHREGD